MLKINNFTSGGGKYSAPVLEPFDFAVEKGFVNSFALAEGTYDDAKNDPWNLWEDDYKGGDF